MRNRENQLEVKAQRAQEKILGTKFCFSCQKQRPLEAGKIILRGKSKTWRCATCAKGKNPAGFTKGEST